MTNEDLLYRYFSNSLTETELADFNNRLEANSDFRAEFEFENNLKQAIKENSSGAIKTKLNIFEDEIKREKSQHLKSKFNWRIAASIVFFLAASWFGYNSIFGVNYNNLFEANMDTYPNTEFAITRSDTIDSFERKAFVAYEAEEYEDAISYFNSIPKVEQKTYQNFYKAHSFLKLNNTQKAKTLFEKEIVEESKFVAEAHWYLALIAIKDKNKLEATRQLRILTEDFDYNKSKAEALLKNLH